jgi:hypothetical protein
MVVVPDTKELHDWEEWALARAGRIDPVISGKYLRTVRDPPSYAFILPR